MHILYSVQTRTHPGKVRKSNQDAFGTVLDWREKLGLTDEILQQRGHLFAVADGMGGHAAGEVASQIAIETLFTKYYTGEWIDPKTTLAAAIVAANRAIFEMAEAHAEMSGMGTTLVAAVYRPEYGLVANVGDSRAYLFRSGRIIQVTRDHSWVAEQVNSGILTEEEAAHHPFRNVITRALGNEGQVEPEFFELPPLPGDTLLLCSDGLSNQVSDREMADILRAYPLDEAADRLVDLALERGAPDNVTLVLVQLQGGAVQRRSKSFLPWLALIAAIIILGGFVLWNFLPRGAQPLPTTTPDISLGTFTPAVTPTATATAASTPTPPPTTTAVATALPEPTGEIGDDEAVVYASPVADDARTLVFVSGDATVQTIAEDDEWVMVLCRQTPVLFRPRWTKNATPPGR
jgi:serine/threonine protein phosphatase PrpC